MSPAKNDVSVRARVAAFAAIAAGATVITLLLKFLAKFDWGVVFYGWTGTVALAAFIGLWVGSPTRLRRWLAFVIVSLTGALAAVFLGVSEHLPLVRVLVFGWVPFTLIMLGAVIWVRRRVAPFRVVQIISAVVLNAYIVAYLQGKILYQGIFKSVLQPILNCYGGPLAVFACPIGSTQQMVGMKLLPWLPLGTFIVLGALVGRAACAWICPFGMWQDLLYKVKVGPKSRGRRWESAAAIAMITAIIAAVLVTWLKLPRVPVFVYAWLPFNLAVLVVAWRGKLDLPKRAWLGGWLAAVGLAVVIWFRLGIGYAVAAGFIGMFVLGLTGRWIGGLIAAGAAFLVGSYIPAEVIGPLPVGTSLGVALAAGALALVLLCDVLLDLSFPATWLKYGVLLLVAGLASYLTVEPWFCKLCPQGTLGAGIPLVLWDPVQALRGLVGWLYWVKVGILLVVIVAAIAIKRPFCRSVCPIGAVYSFFNKGSLMHMTFSGKDVCTDCGMCRKVCPMNIDPHENQNQLECIRCGECVSACPKSGLKFRV